jgi:diguanylate cyclase (GGDEF)-like protein/PAS domain S-box-containing protein
MGVDSRSALLRVSRAALSGAAGDAVVHEALEQLLRVTSCDVAAFYAASKADRTLVLGEQRRAGAMEALPAIHPHLAHAFGSAGVVESRTDDAAGARCDRAVAVRAGSTVYGVLAAASAGAATAPPGRRFLAELADVLALSLRAHRRKLIADLLFKRSRYVFDHNPNPMMIMDAATHRFIDVNQTAIDTYGYSHEQWLTMTPYDLRPPDRRADFATKIDVLGGNAPTVIDTFHWRADGSRLDVHLTSMTVERDGVSVHMITVQDVTARNAALTRALRSETSLAYAAVHDRLTGLPNRSLLYERLTAALAGAREHGRKVAVLFIDVDGFKNVNDTMGHAAGDALLKTLANRLRSHTRQADCVARMGGDEFIAVLDDIEGLRRVEEIARDLLHLTAQPISRGNDEFAVTCSIGIAMFPGDGDDAEALIRNADTAMYQAKRDGRATACSFTPAMHHAAERRLRLDARLRKALDTGGFTLDYQPICELNGTLRASEALIRWPQPDGTVIQPNDFIPYAEESGLIVPIGAWALRSACYRNAAWGRVAPPLRVTVNVSARQLADPRFVQTVRDALNDSGLRPNLLELELTETAMSANIGLAAAVVRELRELGVRIAVDDFGTGYNSLATLRSFVIDTLKLDICFVTDIATSAIDQAIASAVITGVHRLGVSVVAEGVETVEQRAMLAALHCDGAQGFLFGRPMSAELFGTLLRTQQRYANPRAAEASIGLREALLT